MQSRPELYGWSTVSLVVLLLRVTLVVVRTATIHRQSIVRVRGRSPRADIECGSFRIRVSRVRQSGSRRKISDPGCTAGETFGSTETTQLETPLEDASSSADHRGFALEP